MTNFNGKYELDAGKQPQERKKRMERKLSIPRNKVEEIITICQNVAGRSETHSKGEVETIADGLDQLLEYDMPHDAKVIRQLDCLLAELHDNEIYDLVYLYALGKEWAMFPDSSRLYMYKQYAQNDVRAFRHRGRNEAINYIIHNLYRVSKYLRYAENIVW